MRKFIYIYLLGIIALTVACGEKKSSAVEGQTKDTAAAHDPQQVELTPAQYKSVGVQVGKITSKNLSNFIKATGTIEVPPQQTIGITSPYGGNIQSLNVLEGKRMKKGELVATIQNPEFLQLQQDFMETSSQLSFLQQDLARQEELVKENIAARKSLQRAQSEYNTMAARVEGLKAKLKLINIDPGGVKQGNFSTLSRIYAPQDAYVTRVLANVGKFVSPNELVATLANTTNMFVRVRVFEKDIAQVAMSQVIRFRATGDSVERLATIFLIGKDIHEDRTVDVQARIEPSSAKLFPGMFVNAIIELGAATTSALPAEAVVQSGGKNYIFIQQGAGEMNAKDTSNRDAVVFRKVGVGVGVTENGFTAVNLPEGFNQQSNIVTKGAYDLLSKMNNSDEEE